MIRFFFILTISLLLNLNAQEIDPQLFKNLSESQKQEIEKILNQKNIYEEKTVLQADSLEDAEITPDNKIKKFGYDFFNKMPTSVLAVGDLPLPNDYILSLGDKFTVILSGSKDVIFDLNVKLNGTVLFPELGPVYAAGKTFKEFKEDLTSLISESYIGVNVDIAVNELSAKKISIIGAVSTPGVYLVNPFTTVSNALAYSGGIEEFGSLRDIALIKANGEKSSFDLYDLLILGDRSKDKVITAGDTIVVKGTDNFVEINGSVIRPTIYEYKKDDTYQDLINFALGFSFDAKPNDITSIIFENGRKYSLESKFTEEIGNKKVLELFVGNTATSSDMDIFVDGKGVTRGYFSISNQDFGELLNKIKFSDDIYPFYAIYEQVLDSGLTRSKKSFSLADPSTYENFKATKNSKVFFYDREYIASLNEINTEEKKGNEEEEDNVEVIQEDEENILDNTILETDFVQVLLSNESIRVPISGKISPRQIHSFLGITDNLSIQNVSIITTENSISNAYDEVIESETLVAISLPLIKENLITVQIQGEVLNPGKYSLSSSTTLEELYILAGSFRETAFPDGIQLYRQDVKEKQQKAIREAKSILTDSMIQKSSSISERGMLDIDAVLALADLVEPTGRVAGDFGKDSVITSDFILKDGDIIKVPTKSVEVTVQGEVLNSSSFLYSQSLDYQDYIQSAGGFTPYADKRAIFVIRADGQSISPGNNIFSGNITIKPGDTIVVPRDLNQIEALPLISMATKIISDIAFSAASLNAISN